MDGERERERERHSGSRITQKQALKLRIVIMNLHTTDTLAGLLMDTT
jgi:hypothetical protein